MVLTFDTVGHTFSHVLCRTSFQSLAITHWHTIFGSFPSFFIFMPSKGCNSGLMSLWNGGLSSCDHSDGKVNG